MIDRREIELREKKKRKEYNKRNKTPMDSTSIIFISVIAVCFTLMLLMAILGAKLEERDQNDCEAVGGTYKVIDKERRTTYIYPSTVSSREVEIYGCVK